MPYGTVSDTGTQYFFFRFLLELPLIWLRLCWLTNATVSACIVFPNVLAAIAALK